MLYSYRHSQMCSSCVQMFSEVHRYSQMFSRCRFPVFFVFLLKEDLWHFFPPTMLYREEGVSPDTMDPPTAPPMTYCLIGRNPRHMDPKKRIYGQIICCPFHLFSSSTFEVLIHFTSSKFIKGWADILREAPFWKEMCWLHMANIANMGPEDSNWKKTQKFHFSQSIRNCETIPKM